MANILRSKITLTIGHGLGRSQNLGQKNKGIKVANLKHLPHQVVWVDKPNCKKRHERD